jgi:N-acetylmuramoyl-L-alanine amidase
MDTTTETEAASTTTGAVASTTTAPNTAPTAAVGGLGALAGHTIAVDPGHNGRNYQHMAEISQPVDIGTKKKECDTTGTATDAGYTESAHNLDVARRLVAILQSSGANVVLTRSDDNGWGPCITERAAIGNRAGADAAISIHADGGPAGGRGFHVIYPVSIPNLTDRIAGPSQQLALAVRDAYAAGTDMPYSTYLGSAALDARDDLGGLNLSTVPKVFIETGNMRNATDAALLTDPAFRQLEATAIANGLAAYLTGR